MTLRVAPRRSRRLAGATVEFQPDDQVARRPKKKILRTLDIINERDRIDEYAQQEYEKLFGQPLSDARAQALAELFNWSIPEGLFQDDGEATLANGVS